MPRYVYMCECGFQEEVIHSIAACETWKSHCKKCGAIMRRQINAPHIEGSCVFPFISWNHPEKTLDGRPLPDRIEIRNRSELKHLTQITGTDNPYLHVGG